MVRKFETYNLPKYGQRRQKTLELTKVQPGKSADVITYYSRHPTRNVTPTGRSDFSLDADSRPHIRLLYSTYKS